MPYCLHTWPDYHFMPRCQPHNSHAVCTVHYRRLHQHTDPVRLAPHHATTCAGRGSSCTEATRGRRIRSRGGPAQQRHVLLHQPTAADQEQAPAGGAGPDGCMPGPNCCQSGGRNAGQGCTSRWGCGVGVVLRWVLKLWSVFASAPALCLHCVKKSMALIVQVQAARAEQFTDLAG